MKIVVLAGGLSPERNVSLSSGTMIAHALRGLGHQAALVDMYFGLEAYTGPVADYFDAPLHRPVEAGGPQSTGPGGDSGRPEVAEPQPSLAQGVLELCQMADIVFLALHGTCGEDGRVQAAFDLMGIPYTGAGYLGSGLAMDKDLTKRLIAHLGVHTPQWQRVSYTEQEVEDLAAGHPGALRGEAGGQRFFHRVSIAHTRQELHGALMEGLRFGGQCVLEQYVAGRRFRWPFWPAALPSIEIIPKEGFYDYENKYQPGAAEEVCPAPIPPAWEQRVGQAALTVYHALGLSVYSRADFIVDQEGTPWFLEINTLPGMTPTSLVPQEAAAVGIDYASLCQRIIEESLRVRKG